MPFVQIHLAKHFTDAVKKQISLTVHECLIEHFKIPADDYFHVVHALAPGHILYPDSYMGIPHTNNLLYIHITARSGRTPETKRALYRAIATKIAERMPISIDDVIIILAENTSENWSFGRGEAQMIS